MRKLLPILLLTVMALVGIAGYAALRAPDAASGPMDTVPVVMPAASGTVNTTPTITIYEIVPGRSQARFVVSEVLRGEPKTVVGATDQVTGQIAADLNDPAGTEVGIVLVNARTLATDESQRNNAIRRFILSTDQHEYIRFAPTAISGAPATASIGQPATLQIAGDLTIRDVTRPVVFEATVTPVSATELRGTAATTVRYADWGITIPDVPFVASVEDTVRLELDFIATTA